MFSIDGFPRLIVEVNSIPQEDHPTDRTRMLLQGAFVVRFANKFITTFKRKFVLITFYIAASGIAEQLTLFQEEGSSAVGSGVHETIPYIDNTVKGIISSGEL